MLLVEYYLYKLTYLYGEKIVLMFRGRPLRLVNEVACWVRFSMLAAVIKLLFVFGLQHAAESRASSLFLLLLQNTVVSLAASM